VRERDSPVTKMQAASGFGERTSLFASGFFALSGEKTTGK